jgi:hypothetical protein
VLACRSYPAAKLYHNRLQAPSSKPPPARLNPSSSTGVCSPPHLGRLGRLSNLSLCPHDPRQHPHDPHDPHDSHNPHSPHDPGTRPLAGSAAAVAGCAPTRCIITPRPERERAWLFGGRSPKQVRSSRCSDPRRKCVPSRSSHCHIKSWRARQSCSRRRWK